MPPQSADEAWAEDVRNRARQQWSNDPAGALAVADADLGTADGFRRVEEHRAAEQPWMPETFRWDDFAGRDVLEIGVGLGTDHVRLGRAGARLSGIDLTPRCVDLTAARVAQEGLSSDLRVMDAEALAFPDASFDVVYSFGVLHHVAEPERAFAEVRRVLRPGGLFVGGLYNRRSLSYAFLRTRRLLRPAERREPLARWHGRIEHSRSGHPAYVRLFTAGELRALLLAAGFSRVELTRRHAGLGRHTARVPATAERALGRVAGWYLIHRAHA